MNVGVISDTHIGDLGAGVEFLELLCQGPFADVELILHAGDIVHPDLLACFTGRKVIAVQGNCDAPAADLPRKRVLQLANYRIGLIHGWGGSGSLLHHVIGEFRGDDLDVLIFGHSHYPYCSQHGDLLLFNPGSAVDRRDAPYHSVGILTLGEEISAEIVNIDPLFDELAAGNGVV